MRILSATDLFPKSEASIERAGLLADQLGANLTLLHVVEPGESDRALEQTLQTAFAHTRSRGRPPMWRAQSVPHVIVRAGKPAKIIVETAAQTKAQLVVLGPHRKRPLRDALEGTIAEQLVAAKTCPVLVVQDEARRPYRRILLALDFSQASATAIQAAESLVLRPGADARVVHAHEPPYQRMLFNADTNSMERYAEGWRDEAKLVVQNLLAYASTDAARYDIHIEQKQPAASSILRALTRYEPDVLVLGTRGAGRMRRALMGSVANRVLHAAACDVLIVPEGSFSAARHRAGVRSRAVASDELESEIGAVAAMYASAPDRRSERARE